VTTDFLPSRHGFAFPNSWPSQPGVVLAIPGGGSLRIGNAARGLCGGMVFAALDYWHAQSEPPAERPDAGTPLYQFIVRRLVDSWHVPAGVLRYYRWMNLPDGDVRLARPPRRRRGVSWRTIQQHWPHVRASIDAGQPAALGVVTMASRWPGALGHNHQVLAYGYEASGSEVSIAVYDPNSGPDDGVRIAFSTTAPALPAKFAHNISIGWPVRGFFLTGYSPAPPPVSLAPPPVRG
jgi:hypothetical protein